MNKKTIRIGFVDFWGDYIPTDGVIYKTLRKKYDIVIDNDKPEYLFFSCYGYRHIEYEDVVKIFYTHENVFPDFNWCDYSISYMRDSIGGRNLYFPSAFCHDEVVVPSHPDELLNRNFCNFIYSQDYIGYGAKYRKQVCMEIMKYRDVDCPGKVLNNMSSSELSKRVDKNWNSSKINFLKKYKFTIAFENTNRDGYITEKLIDPLLAGSVPIYWGSEGNVYPLEKDCMICANDYPDIDSLMERIKLVDSHDDVYMSICQANPIRKGVLSAYELKLLNFFDNICQESQSFLSRNELKLDTLSHVIRSRWVRSALKVDQWYQTHAILKKIMKCVSR
ncbi:MAG: glycosyltransferase family 10 [Akkermansia sp.]|nr:glycosyltransferase family 10 [Akkermansia sp.]